MVYIFNSTPAQGKYALIIARIYKAIVINMNSSIIAKQSHQDSSILTQLAISKSSNLRCTTIALCSITQFTFFQCITVMDNQEAFSL